MWLLTCDKCLANTCYEYGQPSYVTTGFSRHSCKPDTATHVEKLTNLIADRNLAFNILTHSTIIEYFSGANREKIILHLKEKLEEQMLKVSYPIVFNC